jgi:Glyoxalase-like domain
MRRAISRRVFLVEAGLAGAALGVPRITSAANRAPTLLDHILLGCNDLDRGIAFVEEHTGVRAAFGGVHPGAGTHNALLSLGENRYLEIIAPHPAQPASADSRGLRNLKEPVLVGWAAHPGDIEAFAIQLKGQGIAAIGPTPGSRKRPDGRILHWKTLRLKDEADGLLPFFIEWGADTTHPSIDAPQGCSLLTFEAFTPKPDALWRKATDLRLDLPISEARGTSLHAIIAGPKGQLDVSF